MLIYLGKSPFSLFRQKMLLRSLQTKEPTISGFEVSYVYFVDTDALAKDAEEKLKKVLDPQCSLWAGSEELYTLWVVPRFGTLSPWSSKVNDILKVCHLEQIRRVERGLVYHIESPGLTHDQLASVLPLLHDRMTESVTFSPSSLSTMFSHTEVLGTPVIDILTKGSQELKKANQELGLALSENEMKYLYQNYKELNRNPTETELMMFAQINSEHCRHKIFNATWITDDGKELKSLFSMIKNTYEYAPEGVLSAYKDNGAIIEGPISCQFFPDPTTKTYQRIREPSHLVIKVETHNHPTAISPFAGAATGAGGEIRDEGATGIGGKPKAGLVGFSVSNLRIPLLPQPWETKSLPYPPRIASALEIMLEGPVGAAAYNNEFGRPNLLGYFRTFEQVDSVADQKVRARGYHKPIMLAGGMGQIRKAAIKKGTLPLGALLIILGGPSMLIGLGGGSASSLLSGSSDEQLDFASVQRSNPELQRRCQEVINACWSLGDQNPIISIHDVGAGGLSNAFPELLNDSGRGGVFQLTAIPSADLSLSAMQVWCNEAQERYVLAIEEKNLPLFLEITQRERGPFAVVGKVDDTKKLVVKGKLEHEKVVNLPLQVLFGDAAKKQFHYCKTLNSKPSVFTESLSLNEIVERVLQFPAVADKRFLITIGDRTVTGLVHRDQMVGPWQVAVSDCAVTASSYFDYSGEAMSIGERAPIALLDPAASARIAIGEAITNIVAADVHQLSDIKFSANWMAAAHHEQEGSALFEAVKAVGMELCPALGICIPVGKDSLSMQMGWKESNREYSVTAPMSLIISAFSTVKDIRKTLTPQLCDDPLTEILLIDLGSQKNRLGGSVLTHILEQPSSIPPDLDDPELIRNFFQAIQVLRQNDLLLAYHDRSDGGLMAALCEMSFAGHVGVSVDIGSLGGNYLQRLFSEELGALIQYRQENKERVQSILKRYQLQECSHRMGSVNDRDVISIQCNDEIIYTQSRIKLHRLWSSTSYHMQSLRDNPECAQQEYDALLDGTDPGLFSALTFEIPQQFPSIHRCKPKVAILREQGVNGQLEMAAAFERVGFEPVDVHMTDIIEDRVVLEGFQGLVACGGFSYGDVLGAGRGWANSILYNPKVRDIFSQFFNLPSVFVLGVCNGCQMLANLTDIIPGAEQWPQFTWNLSGQFEARLSLVKIRTSPSIFFQGMENSVIPIVVSHGEGQTSFEQQGNLQAILASNQVPIQFIDHYGEVTEKYPLNPNGSTLGVAALTNYDGRFTAMMPHPERCFRTVQFSWHPEEWEQENSPWIKMFANAYEWLK